MGKKNTLKEQHSWAEINLIDLLRIFDPSDTNKYLPFLTSRLKEVSHIINDYDNIKNSVEVNTNSINFPAANIEKEGKSLTYKFLFMLVERLGTENIVTLHDFHDHLENNRIKNKDISQYKSFEELKREIIQADVKQAQKELKDSTHIVYEDEKWLLIKPLTHLSSLKYGSSTKWCTAMTHEDHYFFSYSTKGILIYIINKETNVKVATHMNLRKDTYENPIKFYNEQDVETDSFFTGIDHYIMDILKKELDSGITNDKFVKTHYNDIYVKEWCEKENRVSIAVGTVDEEETIVREDPYDEELPNPEPIRAFDEDREVPLEDMVLRAEETTEQEEPENITNTTVTGTLQPQTFTYSPTPGETIDILQLHEQQRSDLESLREEVRNLIESLES